MALTVGSGEWAALNTAILMRVSCLLLKQESGLWSYKVSSGNGSLALLYINILMIHTHNFCMSAAQTELCKARFQPTPLPA
jgi:hypothetical protein